MSHVSQLFAQSLIFFREKVPPRPQGQRTEPENSNVITITFTSYYI